MAEQNAPIRVGLLGAGTVGSQTARILVEQKDELGQRIGRPLEISGIACLDPNEVDFPWIDKSLLTSDTMSVVKNADIVVELIGGTGVARTFVLEALNNGASVVTANKALLAKYGPELYKAAEDNHADIYFEAAVGGAIPIVRPLRESLVGDQVKSMLGIVNGTTNYMLTKMTECGADYDTVLKEAQAKGYAEANPSADVDGLDAARKAAILASLAFNTRVQLEDVSVEGITKITPDDIEYAKDLGYVIKLLAVGKDSDENGVDVRVHPVFLPKTHPLASVNGVFNAIFVRGNAIGEAMFYGQGAGSLPTASAVVSDIIDVARDIINRTFGHVRCTCYEKKKLCPLDATSSSYYVRLLVDDKPGVLGAIATAFGDAGVSLKSVIQTRRNVVDHAEIVAITHLVEHKRIEKALKALRKLPVVDEVRNVIRVENEERG